MNTNDILKKIEELEKEIEMLKGQVCINSTRAFPQYGDTFYYIDVNLNVVETVWQNDDMDCEMLYSNNCFKTRGRAEEVAEKIRLLLLLERGHDEYCPGFKPKFEGDDYRKHYYVFYDYMSQEWLCSYNYQIDTRHEVYFDSEESAQKMCNVLNNEEYRKMREAEND